MIVKESEDADISVKDQGEHLLESPVLPEAGPENTKKKDSKKTVSRSETDLAVKRKDPDFIRRAFETGEYPYKGKMRVRDYEKHKASLQVELLKVQKWVKDTNQKVVILFDCCFVE